MFKNCIATESVEEGCNKVAGTSHVKEKWNYYSYHPWEIVILTCYFSTNVSNKTSLLFINKFVMAFIQR